MVDMESVDMRLEKLGAVDKSRWLGVFGELAQRLRIGGSCKTCAAADGELRSVSATLGDGGWLDVEERLSEMLLAPLSSAPLEGLDKRPKKLFFRRGLSCAVCLVVREEYSGGIATHLSLFYII